MRKNCGAMTHEEARRWARKLECQMCVFFDLEIETCNKGKRPKKIMMLDGPNEYLHAHKSCQKFKRVTDTKEDMSGLDRYFAV
jgi:hypothetical protein